MISEELTSNQLTAISLLVYSPFNKKDVAQKIGVSEATLYNWFREEKFRYTLNREHNKMYQTLNQQFAKPYFDLIQTAFEAQVDVLKNGSIDDKLKILEQLWNRLDFSQPFNFDIAPIDIEQQEAFEKDRVFQRMNEKFENTMRDAEQFLAKQENDK